MTLKTFLLAGAAALLCAPVQSAGYGVVDPTKPFNLYARVGGAFATDNYRLTLVKSGNAILARGYNTTNGAPAPTPFTLAEGEGGFTLNGKFQGNAVRAQQASVPNALQFGANNEFDESYRFVAEYLPAAFGNNYVNAQLLSRSAGDAFDEPIGALCTAKNGGYLVYNYGQRPGTNPDNNLTKRPCYGATLSAFPPGVRPVGFGPA